MGITALISTLLGMVGGLVPDLLKEWRDTRAATRERAFLELQNKLQLERMRIEADARIEESNNAIVAQEVAALREHLTAIIEAQARPTGIQWIDGFNAVLRPLAATLILILFLATAALYVVAMIRGYTAGHITSLTDLADAIWTQSQLGFAFEAMLGFLFGARQVRKQTAAI